ncbi:hypothetical protein ACJ70E_08290 [Pseudomonas plecoglossicida]|uniref:hypothetical protein n=1 Tax=Pseudomonas plecoglossicida TaxID=70775 RepID=UPI003977E03F
MPRRKSMILSDEEHIEQLINKARKLLPQNKVTYKADWLHSGNIGSHSWIVINNYESRTTFTIQFNDRMPDGSLLSEPKNACLLKTIQKVAFHLRMGNLTHPFTSYKNWKKFINTSTNIARWLVLNQTVFDPQYHGFRLLTEDHVKAYLKEFAQGGVNSTLKIEERFLELLHSKVKSNRTLDEILDTRYHLDEEFILQSAQWLKSQGAYIYAKRPNIQALSRKYISSLLGCSTQVLATYPNVASLLNQFDILGSVSHKGNLELLKPDDRRIINEDSSIVVRTMYEHRKDLKIFASAHSKLPDEIPYLSASAFSENHQNLLSPNGHTPLIPMEIGLGAINRAAELITVYGEQIVEAVTYFAEQYTLPCDEIKLHERMNGLAATHRSSWHSDLQYGGRPLFERYNVICFSSQHRKYDIEKGITLKTLHQAFYGACALMIGMCKPIREGELSKLPLDCLDSEFEGGGAVITHILEKSGVLGSRQIIQRPIPSVVARAIELLQIMSAKLRKIYNDEDGPVIDNLFYIPHRYIAASRGKSLSATLNVAIDTFCLLLNPHRTPTGKTWKIRVHEMRKFFLLVMYKHHHGDLRRTLGYAAGHITEHQIDEYTSFSQDDPESVKYESECISDRLVLLELGQVSSKGHDGLHALYNHICNHFNVTKIQGLAHDNFIRFLNMLQCDGTYRSTVYTVEIQGPDGTQTTMEFAIQFEGQQDDQFDRGQY